MTAPIIYNSSFVTNPDLKFQLLRDELDWEKRDAPRQEYYCNDVPQPYTYGTGKGRRTYEPRLFTPTIREIQQSLETLISTRFEVCFLNRYLDQSDQLGWHADDSPEMDDKRPIGIVSLGVEREIWFRPIFPSPVILDTREDPAPIKVSAFGEVKKLKLGHGSLCIMMPGMQDTWQHRIPKAAFQCGERISLTFRGYVEP